MKVVASLILLLVNVRLSRCCYGEGQILFCLNIPSVFPPGFSSLVLILKDVGEMNSTVLHSDDLSSVTRLRLENAGVTAVAQGAFVSLQKLTNLSLNQNLLTDMNPNWFGRPDILSELILAENQIEVLSEFMLSGLTGLTSLSLRKNRITTIDPNSFSSQTNLAELDLSENRMTRVSPQVFKSLRSTRIRLDGNPWDCSCGAEEFVDFLKDLQSRNLLDRAVEVTCKSPPSLTGRPVWNVSVCATPPPPGPSSVTQTNQPKPTDTRPPSSETTSRPTSDTNICTLVVVIVLLSLLLLVVCFLAVLHGRKRHNKAVMPGCPKENRNKSEVEEVSSRSSPDRPPGDSGERGNNHWDSEMGRRRSCTDVRAKSANAVLFTSPFCAPVKDQVSLQTETEARSKNLENGAEGKQKPGSESDIEGGFETEKATTNLDKDLHCVSVNTDTVPYLSIGTNQNHPDDLNRQSTDDPGQRLKTSRALGRISTWPPTAVQWQARCKIKENEETEASHVHTAWTPKFTGELNKVEIPSGEDEIRRNDIEDSLKRDQMKVGFSRSPETNVETASVCEPRSQTDMEQLKKEEMIQDAATVTHTVSETPNQIPTPAATRGNKTDPKRAVTSRQKAEGRSTGSKAPSGGASPDDETLLSGNQHAFMDLLHEVVQNNGRWTRERWRQTHANKQQH
ncbi:SLIT and NTRK-like protein 3 isoform X3 [Acanthopagrus latus]|uniref:SLIT and NTRK-like protein 3 isoform X3 n=1 Tax=Acanthopagrus latus TaxID=8177 RepID=UPI00187C27E5|nr:SLIT and NTRK-like protein 3 isoform X3 [Acanthopagrus latus]